MEMKPIIVCGEKLRYMACDDGRIFSLINQRFLKPFKNKCGYMLIYLKTSHGSICKQVHRLIAEAFIPNPSGFETVNHKNGIKSDNRVDNLEWLSRKDNIKHAWKTGLAKPRFGIKNPANVYTEEQIRAVCVLLEQDCFGNKEIAKMCDVNVTLIRDIKFRNKWLNISKEYKIPRVPKKFYDLEYKVIDLIEAGLDDEEILAKVGLPDKRNNRSFIKQCRNINSISLNDCLSDEVDR